MESEPKNIHKENKEKFVFTTRIATPEDWETIKELRELAITGSDTEMMGIKKNLEKQLGKTEKEWRKELSNDNNIYVESWSNLKAIGMGFVTKKEERENTWHLRYGYVLPEFRNNGVGREMFAKRLREVINRGGKEVVLTIRNDNLSSLHVAKSFGAEADNKTEISKEAYDLGWRWWKIDLTKPGMDEIINNVLKGK